MREAEYEVFVSGTDDICEYRIPSMITAQGGTLLAVCDARVSRPGDLLNHIYPVIRRSFDGGRSWSPIGPVVEYGEEEGGADPCLVQDSKSGRIWLFYTYSAGNRPGATGPRAAIRVLLLHCVWSDDDGQSWSRPRNISAEVDRSEWCQLWPSPGRGLQTAAGRLLVPCTARHPASYRMGSYLLGSDDHGVTWRIGPSAGTEINEPTVAELEDGTLLINARSQRKKGCRASVRSADGGSTWSEISDELELIEPNCQGSFIRYRGSEYLFSNPASAKPGNRSNMTIRQSFDEGKTWSHSRQIYPGHSRYSCLTILPDGDIGLLYERDSFAFEENRRANKRIAFARFAPEWIKS